MTAKPLKTITLGELKTRLNWMRGLSDDTLITFGTGNLSFSDAKPTLHPSENSPPSIVNIEFGELYEVIHDFESDA